MISIEHIQKAILEEKLDGWLFCNFSHRDILTDTLLYLDRNSVSSRRWFLLIPATGNPVKIVHAIEKNILDPIPGDSFIYSTRDGLVALLCRFSGMKIGVLSDENIQVLSTIDAASFQLLCSCGLKPASASSLVQRIKGILDKKGICSHEKSAAILYRIVHDAWSLLKAAFKTGRPLYEGDIQDFMLQEFEKSGLVTDHPPIVASGLNSGNPHYSIPGNSNSGKTRGQLISMGDVVQFDLWAKEMDGIYADISWIGFCGTEIPQEIQRHFAIVASARDLVKPAIEKAFAQHTPVTGASLDAAVRAYLLQNVSENAVQHRTGHGIDTDCHGSGTNLDSTEFPDNRCLLEGSCFSVEPGIYFADSGFRTEIDIYILDGKPVISGGEIQRSLLTLQD